MKKTLEKLSAHFSDRIESISDESGQGDGYWIYLKAGWQRGNQRPSTERESCHNEHIVHEWNMIDLVRAMKREVYPCTCWDCKKNGAI